MFSGWLKERQVQNIPRIFVTLDTFHLFSGWLKESLNIWLISVTLDTSLRAGATLPPYVPDDEGDEEDPYLHKVRRAGGFPQYETQVTKSLAEIFEPKFPKLPAEVIPTIVAFWAHVGDY